MRHRLASLIVLSAAPLLFIAAGLLKGLPMNPPVERNRSIESNLRIPPRVLGIMRNACFDCHSSETRWPWYASTPPVSNLIQSDVSKGREALNFSEWSLSAGRNPTRAATTLMAACASVQAHEMPKKPYPALHPKARLDREDVDAFCAWTGEQASELLAAARNR